MIRRKLRTAYDAMDGMKKITTMEIKTLVSQYGKMMDKDRLERIAGVLTGQLTTVVDVETYTDFRTVTFDIYVDRCRVVMIDATLLVRQFGIPVAPRVDGDTVEAICARESRPHTMVRASQGANQGANEDDGDLYGDMTHEEHNELFWQT